MKNLKKMLAMALAVGLVGAGAAMATSQADDSITISMSPPTDYSVTIDTDSYDFGAVELDTVYLSTDTVITVSNSGSVVSDWKIIGSHAATWQLTPFASTTTAKGQDQIGLWAVLSSTDTEAAAVEANEFRIEDAIDYAESRPMVESDGVAPDGRYYLDADGDNVPSGGERRIWFRLRTPSNTTTTAQQDFTVTIEAWDSGEFGD